MKPGRPRTGTPTRAEQLRAGKRAHREREQGLASCMLTLPLRDEERLHLAVSGLTGMVEAAVVFIRRVCAFHEKFKMGMTSANCATFVQGAGK